MIIGNYSHLPHRDQISFVRLLVFIEGLESLARFNAEVRRILEELHDRL